MNTKGWTQAMSADGIQRKEIEMSTGRILTLASMMALFFASASFAGDPGVDYTAEFAAASVPGQPASAR